MAFLNAFGGGVVGSTTAAIGTVFYQKIDPYPTFGSFTAIVHVNMTNGNTANNLTLMRPIGRTTASAAATTASNTVTLTADPGPTGNGIAANDILVTQNNNGTFSQYKVGAWNATTKVCTVTASALAVNISSGARVWNYGIFTDTDPVTGSAHPTLPSIAVNTTGDAFLAVGGGFRGAQAGDPLLIYCPNATGQTIINYTELVYDNGF